MTSALAPLIRSGGVTRRESASARPGHPLVRFAGVGGAATVVQLGLFAALLAIVPQTLANLISWSVSTLVANSAHRSITFGVHGSRGAQRDLVVAAAFSLLSLGASVVALDQLTPDNPLLSVVVLIAVNCVVGLARYLCLRWWFAARRA
jgi:putative flippase GtrA